MRGRIVILSGPSGSGKDTIIDAWIALNPRVQRVITFTTRAPRDGERDGIDYHFVTEEVFKEMVHKNKFLEHKEVYGMHYGSPLEEPFAMAAAGKIAVLKIDVQGAMAAMKRVPQAISIFLMPPSLEELRRRLVHRGTDTLEQIETRMKNAAKEMGAAGEYNFVVVNDSVERAVGEIDRLVCGK